MDLANSFTIINMVAIILIIVSIILFSHRLYYIYLGFKKCKNFPDTDKKGKYAILIPARDESSVIEKLLISIKNQTYDKDFFDVYVITEREDDLSNQLATKYGYNYFVRKDLENKRTKGFALDEMVKDIYAKGLKYDAFFIIDADNTISANYLVEMNKAYYAGIDVCMSYKNVSNIDDNWVSCCSSLLFCNVNTFQNKAKTKLFSTMLVSGTGLYISSRVLDPFKGFPFTTLTEDYELSRFIANHKVSVAYIDTAEVYVEQPVKLSTVNKQRIRWCRGFFDVNKKNKQESRKALHDKEANKIAVLESRLSILPNVCAIITIFFYVIALITISISALVIKEYTIFWRAIIYLVSFLILYNFILSLYTVLQFMAEKDHIRVNKKLFIKAVLLNPFFINLFIYQAIVALFSKNVGWKKIERIDDIIDDSDDELNVSVNNG